jgi:hypothetical protein
MSPQPSRYVLRKGAAPLSGEQTARAISAYAQCACLLYLQMGSINNTRLFNSDGPMPLAMLSATCTNAEYKLD